MKIAVLCACVCVGFATLQAFATTNYLIENDIMYCEENFEQYKLIGDYEFLEREKRTLEARVCVHLYADPVWDYSGKDRLARLLERGNHYVDVEIAQSRENAKIGTIPQQEKPLTETQEMKAKILVLEKKIAELEKKISQKNAVIMEQIKVIMDLANKIKSAVFGTSAPWLGTF